MISLMQPSAFSRSTAPSEKPISSTRGAPMTLARRTCSPSARWRVADPSTTAPHASSGRERGRALDAEVAADPVQGRGRDQAADDALAVIGLQAVDPAGLVRQAGPDRQQQAGDDVERALRVRRHRGELSFPDVGERPCVGLPPLRARQRRFAQCQAINRTDQAHAALHLAVVEHQARRRRLDGGATRLGIDEQARVRAGGGCEIERLGEGHRPDDGPGGAP